MPNPLDTAEVFENTLSKDAFASPEMISNEYSNAPYTLIKRWSDAAKKPSIKSIGTIPSA